MRDDYLDAIQIRAYLGIRTVQGFSRWCKRWKLEPASDRGKRPRMYRTRDYLDAYERYARADLTRMTRV